MDYSGRIITKTAVTPSQTSAPGVWTLQDQILAQQSNTWPVPGVYNPISRSLRFNSADSAYLNRTPSVASNRKTWTWSGWVKRSKIAADFFMLFTAEQDTSNKSQIYFDNNYNLYVYGIGGLTVDLITSQVFRDPSSWGMLTVSVDTTQATASNRIKVYWNGVQITAFGTATYPAQNSDTYVNSTNLHTIGVRATQKDYPYDGYLTEVNFIDGQALTPSSFGTTDPQTGVWVPVAYTGTYGTNGFYLNFKDNTSTTTIGYDYSGNGNNWTANNFSVSPGVGNDSLTDTPTPWVAFNTGGDVGGVVRGNYATLNPVYKAYSQPTFTNGNLDVAPNAVAYQNTFSTISVTSGKWYCEVLVTGAPNSANVIGISSLGEQNNLITNNNYIGSTSGGYGYLISTGSKTTNGSSSAYGNSIASGDVVGVAIDLDNGKIWFSKNGTWQASGDPVAGTNAAFTGITSSLGFAFGGTLYSGASSFTFNFGQRPFAYTPPSGYKSLCTTNLPTPTIGATSTTTAGKYFNVVLYTGNGSTQSITGVGFQPDLVWGKSRSNATNNFLYDAVRGADIRLISDSTAAEQNQLGGGVTAFNSDGFSLGGNSTENGSTRTFVAWNWNAGGSNATNTSGTITSTVRANTTAGFSIVTYTGTGANATVGHGLGVAPSLIIVKRRNSTSQWAVYHSSLGATQYLYLNLTSAAGTDIVVWNNTAPTSSLFSIGTGTDVNTNTGTYVAYCFAAVAGYSAFGSYTGNGSADGPFVYTGFRPRYVMVKKSSASGTYWIIADAVRNTYNVVNYKLAADLSDAENSASIGDSTQNNFDFLSNGFKLRTAVGDTNASGATYIYSCFAESPFKYSLAR